MLVFIVVFCVCVRHEDPGQSAAGHAADVGERAAAVLLRLLHLRHHRCAALGRTSAKPLLSGGELHPVSLYFMKTGKASHKSFLRFISNNFNVFFY